VAFADRFGLTVWTLHNMSELNVPIVSDPNPEVLGTCGRKRAGIELRVVDETIMSCRSGRSAS
jgi:carnitine-CoA ligase